MSYMDGLNFINSFDAANLNTFNNNMAAAQANQYATMNAPAPYVSPVAFGDYNYGTVGGYPSFGEASGGYVYPGYGPRPGMETQYAPEQAFSPSGGAGSYTPEVQAQPQAMAAAAPAAVDWGGLNNSFGVPSNDWNSMSMGDKQTWASLVGANYPKIDPHNNPLGYFEGGYYDEWGNLLGTPSGGGPGGVSSGGMGSVGAPNSGGGAGFVGSGGGYTPAGAGLAPLNPSTGAGADIYRDAGQYLGGDFSGGGSDPYAGTDFAGGGGGSPDFSGSLATPYDQYGSRWTPDGSGGIGADTTAAPPDYNNPWTGYNNGGFDPFQSYYPGQRNIGDGYGGGAGSAGGWGQSFSPAWQPGQSVFDTGTSPTPFFNDFLVPDFQVPNFQWRGQQSSEAGTPYGQGGIGADALHDVYNWQLAQSSPYAEAWGAPNMSNMPNIGYNPGMENWFANPGMQQSDPSSWGDVGYWQSLLQMIDKSLAGEGNAGDSYGGDYMTGGGEWGNAESDTLNQGDRGGDFNAGAGGDASFEDRYSAAPPITPGLQPQAGDFNFPMGITAGVDPSPNLPGTFVAPPSQEQLAPETGLDFIVPDVSQDTDAVRAHLLNSMNQAPPPDDATSMADYQSPANDYNTFQKGPTFDWQSSMVGGRNDPRVINGVYKAAGETGLPPAVIAAILNTESRWDPATRLKGQFGLAQMSGDMWGDNPFKGEMGGADFETYKTDPVGDQQIRSYTDWLTRGGKLDRHGIDVASVTDPVMQAAMLQAIQFAGNSRDWRNALSQGNMDMYVTTAHPQAKELRPGGETYPTINSMYNAYDKIFEGWRR